MIKIISARDKKDIERIKKRSSADFELVLDRVRPIIRDVKIKGDKALSYYSEKYDNFKLTKANILIKKEDIERAYKKVDKDLIAAFKAAKKNIERYCMLQKPKEWFKEVEPGITLGQLVRPLEKVGCYIPAGAYPLPSSVLMTVVPAKVAGVKEVIICSPPRENNYDILVAADIAGADKIFRIGGAQAVAAMAYGTESIPKVDKIVGPGNIFVTAAKKLVYGDTGLDFLAGPSEIMIIAEKGNPEIMAADMLAQAEHDRLASAVLVTTNKKLAEEVKAEINKQLKELNNITAQEAIRKYSAIIIAKSIGESFDIANDFAPEHLEIISEDKNLLKKVKSAGAVFLGEYSCEAAGDYCSGPSHVLPTAGFARIRAGLSVLDFVKMPSFQSLSKNGLERLKGTITKIAGAEGLKAHKRSVEKRFR